VNDEPRFVVTSLTGYGKTRRKLVTQWYVVDRAWCYRTMRKFQRAPFRNNHGHGGGPKAAQRYADHLNETIGWRAAK
jgi:hypothetical protein